jgi:hypothetical protein
MSKKTLKNVYQTLTHPDGESVTPVYTIENGKFYRTVDHNQGWSELPDYEMFTTGFVFRTRFHHLGTGKAPDYRLQKDGMMYQTGEHPLGARKLPVYRIEE